MNVSRDPKLEETKLNQLSPDHFEATLEVTNVKVATRPQINRNKSERGQAVKVN